MPNTSMLRLAGKKVRFYPHAPLRQKYFVVVVRI